MTLLELVTHLRRNILYDTGGVGVDWASYSEDDAGSAQLRWTNEELVSNIQSAIDVVYRRVNPIEDIYSLSVIANTQSYTLPSYIKHIRSIRRADGKSLKEMSIKDQFNNQTFYTTTGELESYYKDEQSGKLLLYKTPVEAETISLHVDRLPKVRLSWDNNDVSPELREEYQIPMLAYAASRCYMKDEANTFDPARSAAWLGEFNREFPETSVYSNIRKSRTSNRSVRYGGL